MEKVKEIDLFNALIIALEDNPVIIDAKLVDTMIEREKKIFIQKLKN